MILARFLDAYFSIEARKIVNFDGKMATSDFKRLASYLKLNNVQNHAIRVSDFLYLKSKDGTWSLHTCAFRVAWFKQDFYSFEGRPCWDRKSTTVFIKIQAIEYIMYLWG